MHGVLFIGHSKLPQGAAVRDVSETFALSCVVDPRYGVIMDASSTLVTRSAARVLEDILIGHNLLDGMDAALAELRERYHGSALAAIDAALRDVAAQWRRSRDGK